MPRAYIEMILSSKPGKRRWYLAISCGSNRAWRSRGNLQLDPAGIGDHRLLAITTSPVARLFAGEMMVHLGVEDSFRQGLLQIVEQPARVENRLRLRLPRGGFAPPTPCRSPGALRLSSSYYMS